MKINEVEEEKHSRFWSIALRVSTLAVICIGIFFIVKLFTTSPVEGKWVHQDSTLVLDIPNIGKQVDEEDEDFDIYDTLVKATWVDENSGNKILVGYDCELDYKGKAFTLKLNSETLNRTVKDAEGVVSESAILSSARSLEGTYEYSISFGELTLINDKYDGAMVFDKKKK